MLEDIPYFKCNKGGRKNAYHCQIRGNELVMQGIMEQLK